jgi:hypothetical protein
MQPTVQLQVPSHPWLGQLHTALDSLAAALLRGDAPATEQASAAVQAILQRAPQSTEMNDGGQALRADIRKVSERFAQLRQAVLRNAAQSQRAVQSLLPRATPATYGRQHGPSPSSNGGAGRGFLTA